MHQLPNQGPLQREEIIWEQMVMEQLQHPVQEEEEGFILQVLQILIILSPEEQDSNREEPVPVRQHLTF